MTNRFRELIAGARALESRLASVLETAARNAAGSRPRQPLEIIEQAVDDLVRHVVPAGRGRLAFAFNGVQITFAAATPERQAQFELLCAGPPALQDRVTRRLLAAGSDAAAVEVTHAFATTPDPSWTSPEYHVALTRVEAAEPDPVPPARVDLAVTRGTADRATYSFTTTPIAIGRGVEVRDARHRLLRINHIAFTEGADEVTQSVSRRHARIELDAETGRFRLVDDNSAQGTNIIRGGRGIAVPRGSRGLALQDGDEIVLGEARLRVGIQGVD